MINRIAHEGGGSSAEEMQQMPQQHNAQVVIEQGVIGEMERNGGYPKQYVIMSLQNDELNYATAYYYLLCTEKEY